MLIIDDDKHFSYVVTWNLELNREHALYQFNYPPNVLPENLLVKSYGGNLAQNFNILILEGAMINLEHNTPC